MATVLCNTWFFHAYAEQNRVFDDDDLGHMLWRILVAIIRTKRSADGADTLRNRFNSESIEVDACRFKGDTIQEVAAMATTILQRQNIDAQ